MKRLLTIALCALVFAACDDHRDLYTHSWPLLEVHGDWQPSLGTEDMSGAATAMLFRQGGGASREYFTEFDPDAGDNHLTARVQSGRFDVVIFNGLMQSEGDTGLDYVEFRNASRVSTLEAVAASATADERLSRASTEYIAANDMQVLATAHTTIDIAGGRGYYLKYVDGVDQHPVPQDYLDGTVSLTPRAVSYYAQVVVHLTNPGSASSGVGAVRGFSRSVMLASRLPSHSTASHHVRLGNIVMSGTNTGSVSSQVFVTFGPPLDLAQDERWNYELELSFTLRDGLVEGGHVYDIAPQISAAAEQIRAGTLVNSADNPIVIEIGPEEGLELPLVDSSVDVDEWENGETIPVPITDDTEQIEYRK